MASHLAAEGLGLMAFVADPDDQLPLLEFGVETSSSTSAGCGSCAAGFGMSSSPDATGICEGARSFVPSISEEAVHAGRQGSAGRACHTRTRARRDRRAAQSCERGFARRAKPATLAIARVAGRRTAGCDARPGRPWHDAPPTARRARSPVVAPLSHYSTARLCLEASTFLEGESPAVPLGMG